MAWVLVQGRHPSGPHDHRPGRASEAMTIFLEENSLQGEIKSLRGTNPANIPPGRQAELT